ncbi:MAG: OsmC family protein [Candidatus Hydrogenedentes bacterium]|nr:OsmC family protein [Candidatus Hydrogenedentota bacterium]
MTEHKYSATVTWQRRPDEPFLDNRYSRGHLWQFDGGVTVPASGSPQVVPLPMSVLEAVDPEEAFVAALSSCHMLFLLAYAAQRGYVIDQYTDQAAGWMGKNAEGRTAMLKIALRPRIDWGGDRIPTAEEIQTLHEKAHRACFIANSVKSEVVIEAMRPGGAPT